MYFWGEKMNNYPTKEHENAANKMVEILSKDKGVLSILLTNSCVRGMATKDSCLDMEIIIKNIKNKEKMKDKIEKLDNTVKEFIELKKVGKFSHMDIHVSDGKLKIKRRDWTSGPDEFELEIGNMFVYSKVLYGRKSFERLKKQYLPYYDEKLRKQRLEEVKKYCLNNLEHVPLYVKRQLYFQAFDRIYKANQEFMQALFISRKVYPIAYDKWIKYQFYDILKMPELYELVKGNISIANLESDELVIKAEKLKQEVMKLK